MMTQHELSDEQLALQLQKGNQSAMTALYNRYYLTVFRKCLSFTKNTDDAQDLAQDVMLKVLEKVSSFKGESKFSTWLYAVTFNYCTDHQRKHKKKYHISLEEKYDLEDTSEEQVREYQLSELKEQRAAQALALIGTADQQLLMLKYHQNKSIQELQAMYQLSASAVKMRLSRAKAKACATYQAYLVTAA